MNSLIVDNQEMINISKKVSRLLEAVTLIDMGNFSEIHTNKGFEDFDLMEEVEELNKLIINLLD